MADLLNSPFWYFKKNIQNRFDLILFNYQETPISTDIRVDKITRLQAEFCTALDIELMDCLSQTIDSLRETTDSEKNFYIANVMASMRFKLPMMIDANDHFDDLSLQDLDVGDVVSVSFDDSPISIFVTGIFDDSLQAVILTDNNSGLFKPFQNLYVTAL